MKAFVEKAKDLYGQINLFSRKALQYLSVLCSFMLLCSFILKLCLGHLGNYWSFFIASETIIDIATRALVMMTLFAILYDVYLKLKERY